MKNKILAIECLHLLCNVPFILRVPGESVCRLLGGLAKFSIQSETWSEKKNEDVIKEQRKASAAKQTMLTLWISDTELPV